MAKKEVTKDTIKKGYQDYLLEEGKAPETVRIFTKHLKIADEDFYQYFGSLTNIEAAIWKDYFHRSLEIVQNDPDFDAMSSREKHLSYLFTLLEMIKKDRSYILYRLENKTLKDIPSFISDTRKVITNSDIDWAKPFQFIPERNQDFIQSAYKNVLWQHSMTMILFWVKDDSAASKETDIFIEKSTRTVFDIGELPALDSVVDLSKFFLQRMGFAKAN